MNRFKDIVYDLISRLATAGPRKISTVKKLLIIRVDEIGDYMLWHKFLEETIHAEVFRDHEIHFCGNRSWSSLFNTLDTGIADHTLWLDKQLFKKNMTYRYRFLRSIYRQHYDVVINPAFSRDKRYDDCIAAAANAGTAYAMVANRESLRPHESGYDKHMYSHLFEHSEKPVFEFYRNRLFSEFITGNRSPVHDTKIPGDGLPPSPNTPSGKYFVVFPGSRSPKRIWPAANFIRVSNYLFETFGWTAVVCGTESDQPYTLAFCSGYQHPCNDLTGKTSLADMLSLLSDAQCLLSVDTGSVHLAAAVGCPVFGIFNGSQYGRFAPYPREIAPAFHAIYPDEIEKELQDASVVHSRYEFVVPVPYELVRPEKMIHEIYEYYASPVLQAQPFFKGKQ